MAETNPRLEKLFTKRQQTLQGGGPARVDKQHAKGSLTARERVALLLDPGTFRELEAMSIQQNTTEGGGN